MSKIIELRNKRNTLWEQTKAFLEEHRDSNGLVAADAVEQYDKMAADVKALGDEIKRLEDQMEMDAKLSAPTSAPVHADPKADTRKPARPTATDAYNKAFWDMMRGNNSMEVRDALSVGVNENGGFTVPDEFERQLIQGLEENNIFRTLAHTIHTNSGTRTIPIATDSGSASWIEEGAAIQESDMSFAQETLSAYKLGCMIKVSNELLNDSAFNIAAHIAQRFGVRFGNAEEDAFINGTGPSANPQTTPSQPTGILTSLTASAGNTTEDAVTVHFDNIYKLYYSLKSPYRRKASFLCNETLLLQLMLLKDKNDNYIWKPGLEVGKPDTILGRPIYTSGYMPALTGEAADAGKKVLLFGDFSYYWIADRQSRTLKRLNELYAVTDQVGFIGTQRVDGKLILPEAMQVMAMGSGGGNG
ncbi:MAG: phage major capsid protein [Clostridia bacterium]|nr:phage major capsid protein [Clostridia bacterium]